MNVMPRAIAAHIMAMFEEKAKNTAEVPGPTALSYRTTPAATYFWIFCYVRKINSYQLKPLLWVF